jgi:hypothetical protein
MRKERKLKRGWRRKINLRARGCRRNPVSHAAAATGMHLVSRTEWGTGVLSLHTASEERKACSSEVWHSILLLLRPTQSVLLFVLTAYLLHCYSCTKICREIKRKHLLLFGWVVDFSANVFTQINLNCFYWYFTCCLFLSQVDDSGFGLWVG